MTEHDHEHDAGPASRDTQAGAQLSVEDQAVAAGATEVGAVTEQHRWLRGRIQDPFGHHWEIGKPVVPWLPPTHRTVS